MNAFRGLLIVMFIGIVIFTIIAGINYGWDLWNTAIENFRAMNWSGQFNYDFVTYLILSGLWVAWRYQFSVKGIILGVLASLLGIFFFAPYLFVLSIQTNGDMKEFLLGKGRTNDNTRGKYAYE